MNDQWPIGWTMAQRVAAVLQTVPPAWQHAGTVSLAAMYAEAIDDDDEGDGLFRFGAKLRVSLEALGLGSAVRALLLPAPAFGRASAAPLEELAPRPPAQVRVGPWSDPHNQSASAA